MRIVTKQDFTEREGKPVLKGIRGDIQTLSLIEFATRLKTCIDYVAESNRTIKIDRKGKGGVVLMSKLEFDSIMENLHLLGNSKIL